MQTKTRLLIGNGQGPRSTADQASLARWSRRVVRRSSPTRTPNRGRTVAVAGIWTHRLLRGFYEKKGARAPALTCACSPSLRHAQTRGGVQRLVGAQCDHGSLRVSL